MVCSPRKHTLLVQLLIPSTVILPEGEQGQLVKIPNGDVVFIENEIE